MESLIKLTVRTPNQRFDDIQVDCDLRWTVRKLKEYLEDVYPSKPVSIFLDLNLRRFFTFIHEMSYH